MNFLMGVNLEYGGSAQLLALSEEAWEALRKALPPGRLKPFAERGAYMSMSAWICDIEEAIVWGEAGVNLVVSRIKGVAYPVHPKSALAEALNGHPPMILNISVANVGLYDVKLVRYEEDCCTVYLQGLLDKGWRLLAVCPPNDARRPTYILGHSDANRDLLR